MPISDDQLVQRLSRRANSVANWAGPVKVFGWILIVLSAIGLAFAVLAAVLGLVVVGSSSDSSSGILGATAGFVSAVTIAVPSAVVLVQGALILMLANYALMRADEILLRLRSHQA